MSLATITVAAFLVFASSAQSAQHVLDVGDSHTWLAGDYWPAWQVDSRPGRQSTEGVTVLATDLRGYHDEVVFDLATNDARDPLTFAANLHTVLTMIGHHRDLTLVTSFVPAFGLPYTEGVNAAIESFAHHHPQRVTVVEWAAVAAERSDWWAKDAVHFTGPGYEVRKAMIRAGVRGGRF
jgi:hypothetical protein